MAKSKFSTKKVHFNPKKKKPNTNHRQRYWKKENKKIDKSHLIQIKSPRKELEEYLGNQYIVQGFLTNTYGYDTKRLVHSIILPIKKDDKNLYINHAWVSKEETEKVSHGYHKFNIKIIRYKDQKTGDYKYGIEILSLV